MVSWIFSSSSMCWNLVSIPPLCHCNLPFSLPLFLVYISPLPCLFSVRTWRLFSAITLVKSLFCNYPWIFIFFPMSPCILLLLLPLLLSLACLLSACFTNHCLCMPSFCAFHQPLFDAIFTVTFSWYFHCAVHLSLLFWLARERLIYNLLHE